MTSEGNQIESVVPKLPARCSAAEAERRRWELETARARYHYNHELVRPAPLPDPLPEVEDFAPGYKLYRAGMYGRMIWNVVRAFPTFLLPWSKPEHWKRMFQTLPIPDVAKHWQRDGVFARQRIAGLNTTLIRRIDDLPSGFDIDRGRWEAAVGGPESPTQLGEQNRLYLVDYTMFDELEPYRPSPWAWAFFGRRSRHFVAPTALFTRDGPTLRPLAIRLGQKDGAPVFIPSDGPAWMAAKYFVQAADNVATELYAHLGRIHLVTNGFAMATARQLSREHPLGMLLRAHTQYLLKVNDQFTDAMPRFIIGCMAPFSRAGVDELVKRAFDGWDFQSGSFHADLQDRRIATREELPEYPYRDDGQKLWAVTNAFVDELVSHFYPSDEVMRGDTELRAWLRELRDEAGGRVRGLPSVDSVDDLRAVITQLVFQCGPQHATIHSPAYDFAAYGPNMAMHATAAPPESPADARPIVDYIPRRITSMMQLFFHYGVSDSRWNRYGAYGFETRDAAAADMLDRFLGALVKIEEELASDDAARKARTGMGYPYLLPSRIYNSMFA